MPGEAPGHLSWGKKAPRGFGGVPQQPGGPRQRVRGGGLSPGRALGQVGRRRKGAVKVKVRRRRHTRGEDQPAAASALLAVRGFAPNREKGPRVPVGCRVRRQVATGPRAAGWPPSPSRPVAQLAASCLACRWHLGSGDRGSRSALLRSAALPLPPLFAASCGRESRAAPCASRPLRCLCEVPVASEEGAVRGVGS